MKRTRQSRKRISSRSSRAFSLLEVVIALTILGMITTTLFAIIKGSVKGAGDIERLQRENDQINRFLELCRVTIQTMPSSAILTLTNNDPGSPAGQELTISGAPKTFGFGSNPISYEDTIIGLRPDTANATTEEGQPRFQLGISRKDLIPQTDDQQITVQQDVSGAVMTDDQGRYWMPLLPGVVQMKWRFWKDSSDEWMEDWSESDWPGMIELQLQMEGRTLPIRMVYSPPELQLRLATQRANTNSKTTSSAPNAQQQGGGGNNGGQGGGRGGDNGGGGRGGRGDGGQQGPRGGGPGQGGGGQGGPGGPPPGGPGGGQGGGGQGGGGGGMRGPR